MESDSDKDQVKDVDNDDLANSKEVEHGESANPKEPGNMKPRPPRRRRIWIRLLVWAIVLAVLWWLVKTFPTGWGPRLAVAVARHVLPHGEGYENEIAVERISLKGVQVGKVRLGGLPAAPSLESAEIRYTLPGLMRKRIDSAKVSGFTIKPEYKVPNLTFASKAFVGEKVVNPDPLQGWTIGVAEGDTGVIDFAPLLTPQVRAIFPSTTLRGQIRLEHGATGYAGRIDGDFWGGALAGRLDYIPEKRVGSIAASLMPRFAPAKAIQPGDLTAKLTFGITSAGGYGVAAKGTIACSDGSVEADVRADVAPAGIDIAAEVSRRELNEQTPLLASLLSLAAIPPTVTDIAFSAAAQGSFRLGVTNALPQWTLETRLRNGSASMKSGGIPMSLSGASGTLVMKGIGPHFDIMPMPFSFTNAAIATVSLDAGRAIMLADQESLVISEGSVGFCGGFIRLYALYLSFKRLSTGFTVFVDGVEVEKFLTMFPQLAGTTATGRLYGRIPLYIFQNGSEIRLRDSFLYTPPGDVGKICVGDAERVAELLASGGLPQEIAANLGKALRNLDYDVLRLDLQQPRGGGDGKLIIRLRGESREGKTVTPVDVNISLNGALEKVLNYALKAAKLKGK
jgi:hypothetical protein